MLFAATTREGPGKLLGNVHQKMRDYQAREPANAIVLTVLGAAAAFYVAERGKNPKVTSFYDALVYAATNLSVGYSDIFAKTPGGKVRRLTAADDVWPRARHECARRARGCADADLCANRREPIRRSRGRSYRFAARLYLE